MLICFNLCHLKLKGKEEQDLFVNICSWKRLPTEESESEPIRIMSGFKKGLKLQNGEIMHTIWCKTFSVVYSYL